MHDDLHNSNQGREMGGTYITHGKWKNAYKVLIWKQERIVGTYIKAFHAHITRGGLSEGVEVGGQKPVTQLTSRRQSPGVEYPTLVVSSGKEEISERF